MSQPRLRSPLMANRATEYSQTQQVGAQSRKDLFPDETPPMPFWRWLLSFGGRNSKTTLTWAHIAFALTMETVGAALLTTVIGGAKWGATSTQSFLNALYVAIAYAVAYFLGTRWVNHYPLRRHLLAPITVGYMCVGEIGPLGALCYVFAQYLGCFFAGGAILRTMVSGLSDSVPVIGASVNITRSLVPMPTNDVTSLGTVACLEIFGAAFIVFVLLINEFLNTPNDTESRVKNFDRSSKIVAVTIFVIVLFAYPYGAYCFSNTAYFGPLFAGVNAPTAVRSIDNLAAMSNTTFYPNTVSNGGPLWPIYIFGTAAGGIAGAGLFWLIFILTVNDVNLDPKYKTATKANRGYRQDPSLLQEEVSSASVAAQATQLTALSNPLLPKQH